MQNYFDTERFVLKPGTTDRLNPDLAMLQRQLDAGGIMAALRSLNARVGHRFTAVYKFQGEMQRAVFICDKLGQPGPCLNAIPIADSLSRFITPTQPFGVADSTTDGRLSEYKYRGVVASYYGVSLSQAGGKPVGSLCHFDFDVQPVPEPEECIFMNRARSLLLTRLNGFH